MTVGEAPGGLTMAFGANPNGYELAHWDRDTFTYSAEGLVAYLKFGVTFVIGFDGVAEAVMVRLVSANPDVEPATFTRVAGS